MLLRHQLQRLVFLSLRFSALHYIMFFAAYVKLLLDATRVCFCLTVRSVSAYYRTSFLSV